MSHYIQIPPDSTGKKIRQESNGDVSIKDLIPNFNIKEPILLNKIIRGSVSNARGIFVGVHKNNSNKLYLKEVTLDFQENERLIFEDIDGVNIEFATVDTYSLLHNNVSVIADGDVPSNIQRVSSSGSAHIRFTEGEQLFDAFGYSQFRNINTIDTHQFSSIDDPYKYFDVVENGGEIIHEPSQSSIRLVVNSTMGSKSCRTSRNYYPYIAGEGNFTLMSLALSEKSKSGLVSYWGFMDDSDGVYFKLDEGILNVCILSSIDGVSTETCVDSTNFNGISPNYEIDYSKFNLFWIDYQWLGVGKVRYGTISPMGERITLHTIQNANHNIRPYMKSGSLPLRWAIENKESTTSPSEMKVTCAQVANQTGNEKFKPSVYSYTKETSTLVGDDYTYLLSIRAKGNINGFRNKIVTILHSLEIISSEQPIILKLSIGSDLTGSTFTSYQNPSSSIEVDIDATDFIGGITKTSFFIDKGATTRDFDQELKNSILLNPVGDQLIYTLSAKSAVPTQTTDVWVMGNWVEFQ